MENCKNRIVSLLLCSMMLSMLMPISVFASESKVPDGVVAPVGGVDVTFAPYETGAETAEDLPPLMEAAAPALTGSVLLTDWTYTEEADRIILDQYIGTSPNVVIPGVLDGKSVVINGSKWDFLPEDTETLAIGDAGNRVALTGNSYRWWPRNLVEADLRGLHQDFINVNLFQGMTRLERVDVTGWDVSKVGSFSSAFEGCTSLRSIDLSTWDVSSATTFSRMFEGCTSLERANLSGWNLPNVVALDNFVANATNLRELDLSGWTVGATLSSTYGMFYGAHSLEELNLSGWDVSNLTAMQSMFRDCYSLRRLNLDGWQLAPKTGSTMNTMFSGCKSLTELDLNNWDISNVTSLHGMFYETNNLETLKIGTWDTSKVMDMANMFYGASKLRDFEVEDWDTSSVITMENMFYGSAADEAMDLSKWDTSKVADMTDMFAFCKKLQLFDLSSFEVALATKIEGMFRLAQSDAVPTFIVSKDERIKAEYADHIEGRVYGGPSWNANGGQLSNGRPTATWGDTFVFSDKGELITTDVAVFDRYTAGKDGSAFQGWFLDEEGTQEFKIDRNNPKEFDLMSDPKYVNMSLYAGWGVPKSRITGYVKTEANRNITASLKRGGEVIATAAAIRGEFVMADVEAGAYTLELSAPAALTRPVQLTVETGIDLEVATVADPLTLIYGDANGDGMINGLDIDMVITWFGAVKGDEGYTESIDVNADGMIDGLDIDLIQAWFGSTPGSYE